MTMTVADLREVLDQFEPDVEVRLMSQQSWPFEYSIRGTWTATPEEEAADACGYCGLPVASHRPDADGYESHEFEPYNDDRFAPEGRSPHEVVYLVEGSQLAYGTKQAWSEAERPWSR